MKVLSLLSQVLNDLEAVVPAGGPTRGQLRLLERLYGYQAGTAEELERIRQLLDGPTDATPTSTPNREETE